MSVHGVCKLCGNTAKLVKSHIIPEWAYKRLFDEKKHRLMRVASDDLKAISFLPTGVYDRFLCDACESSFKELDEYGRAIIFSKPGEQTFGVEPESAPHGLNILKIDYNRLKLFQLSVLWRAAVCDRDVFAQVDLGEHEPRIRRMLLNNEPGVAEEYGCVMYAVKPAPKEMLHELILPPETCDKQGWRIVRFLFAGCIWLYVIAEDASEFPLRRFFARPGVALPVLVTELAELPGLVSTLQRLRDQLEGQDGDRH